MPCGACWRPWTNPSTRPRNSLTVNRTVRPPRCGGEHSRLTTMDSTALRALQAPLKDQYRADPDSAVITLKAQGTLDDQHIACKVETGRALAVAGLHPATGGSGAELCSGDMLL